MNTMLENKQFRKALAERYLDADTTIREEQMLAQYYASHQPDDDEMQIAAILRMTHAGASDMIDTADFDRITKSHSDACEPAYRPQTVAAGESDGYQHHADSGGYGDDLQD